MSEIDSLLENKELFDMLEFETQIFLDIVQTDALIVAAKGLNLDVVILNILNVYHDPGNLVLVLNCSEGEEAYYRLRLGANNVYSSLHSKANEREDQYLSGGIHFTSANVLVVDMLRNRIPVDKITGIVVFRAHSIVESCQEAFVLRLYRQRNKTGFIKGFSNSVQSFTFGFSQVERVMRTLFVKHLYIWPRFHSLVRSSLKRHEPAVIELHIPISEKMGMIQTCILELMNLTVNELKRLNRALELQTITVENCLTRKFHKLLQSQLDCVWYQLSEASKQLIADLKVLRHLIIMLFYADPVTFYSTVCGYRTMEYAQTSRWVLMEPAELLFGYASKLVYVGDKEFNPEPCPKWSALQEILQAEIPTDIESQKLSSVQVLVLCEDNRTCHQLNNFLLKGPHHYLFYTALRKKIGFKKVHENYGKYEQMPGFKTATDEKTPKPKKRKGEDDDGDSSKAKEDEVDEDEFMEASYALLMSQSMIGGGDEITSGKDGSANSSQYCFEPFSQMENMDLTQAASSTKSQKDVAVLIRTFRNSDSSLDLQKTLAEIRPNYIVMYHSNVTAIRNIELYESRRKKDSPLKVFFLIHAGTVEEQSYLTTLRREKEAFEFLIQTKATMVVPESQDGKSDDCLALQRETREAAVDTRKGGNVIADDVRNVVIVDIREFRSELPALIHKRGIEIEPLRITVGDYILTPDICVERKSLSDLIMSLNSGRLYQQCTQMGRFYAKPMLLIEFDQNKPFSWQNNYMISSDGDSFRIQQKLLLLTLHFPKLKILWSASPYASAQLFEELKAGKDQPDVKYATAISEQDLDSITAKYNHEIYDLVQKLPGITSKNIDTFLRRGQNLDNVIKKSEDELKDILGNGKDAKTLHSILHEEHTAEKTAEKGKFKGKFPSRYKRTNK